MSPYRLAPEWGRQDAVIVVWPHANSDWSNDIEDIEVTYIELCKAISNHQRLVIVAYDEIHILHIEKKLNSLQNLENIIYTNIPTNDTWVRDYGPICVDAGTQKIILNFEFDAWGEKYAYDKDNQFNENFKNLLDVNISCLKVDFILEAGNIEINSKGELLSSITCFNRNSLNKRLSWDNFEDQLTKYFGVKKIDWIDIQPLVGDDTDGHIDTLARYCSDDTIVYSSTQNTSNKNYGSLKSLEKQLSALNKHKNNSLNLIPLELPAYRDHENQILPATYTNFLITNKIVLVPVFHADQDRTTLKLIDDIFPNHEIIDIESNTLIRQLGGIHCATMQLPEGTLN